MSGCERSDCYLNFRSVAPIMGQKKCFSIPPHFPHMFIYSFTTLLTGNQASSLATSNKGATP